MPQRVFSSQLPPAALDEGDLPPSSRATPNPDAFSPVFGHPGVVSSQRLKLFFLGITTERDILCCIACDKTMLLPISMAHEHIQTHAAEAQRYRFSPRRIRDICSRYAVYDGLLTDIPKPTSCVAPFPFLETHKAFHCLVCHEDTDSPRTYLARKSETMRNHFTKHHRGLTADERAIRQREVCVQSFSHPDDKNHRDFIVLPELALLPEQDESELHGASPKDMYEAFVESYRPSDVGFEEGTSLKDTQPFVHFSGWAAHIRKIDPRFLCGLVRAPEPDSDLNRLLATAKDLFARDQLTLKDAHEFYRLALMDEGNGPPEKPLRALQANESVESYGRTWGLFAVFCVRLFRLQKANDQTYGVRFTHQQLKCLEMADAYCRRLPDRPRAIQLFTELSRSMWFPEDDTYFEHIAEDHFNDPTIRFGMLSCLRPDGTFDSPRNCAHKLVQLKYVIRVGLFLWARRVREEMKKCGRGKTYTPQWLINTLAPALTRRAVTPFASVCSAVSQASLYASTSTNVPNVTWTSDSRVVVDGHAVEVPEFQKAVADLINETEKHILDNVLLGVKPEDADFDVKYGEEYKDDYSSTQPRYSFINDSSNKFKSMQFSLAREFFKSPRASFLYRGLEGDQPGSSDISKRKVVWREDGVDRWLSACEKATKMLSFHQHGLPNARNVLRSPRHRRFRPCIQQIDGEHGL
ncbi:hypothetical protein CTheo_8773 [Ceratobasidium theobromae]|uniref:Uncharacterized protein n=1 Tax=Ceratobasidium theobromae TaxID=1582974 RepID=A0A5N5Q7S2_9AGAM|nr:hypothetical protein CTheo_8773 [Ceratobasidium theobromae]